MENNIVKPSQIFFCSECGSQMIEELIPAEDYVSYYPDGSYNPYSKFDKNTGRRQFVYKYKCPKGKGWRNNHDEYTKDNIITI